jgi:hypothetical protein
VEATSSRSVLSSAAWGGVPMFSSGMVGFSEVQLALSVVRWNRCRRRICFLLCLAPRSSKDFTRDKIRPLGMSVAFLYLNLTYS